jgi:hypothetical protein
MTRRYLAFDIETAKDVPGDDFNWKAHRPLGISCAAALRCDADEPMLWYGKKDDGTPAGQMSRDEAGDLVRALARLASEGYTLLTWNGLGFDFDVLAEELPQGWLTVREAMQLPQPDTSWMDRAIPRHTYTHWATSKGRREKNRRTADSEE